MRRLTHHQYTRISMIEDILAELELTGKIGLYVDTWRPTYETWTRITLTEEEALLGSVDGEWYEKTILGLMLADDGMILGDEGAVLLVNDRGEVTLAELTEYLTGYTTED